MVTALVMTVLCLGLLGTLARADEIPAASVPADPAPALLNPILPTSFPEDPWDRPLVFPEDPWPDL
jgi:hypothetical protein